MKRLLQGVTLSLLAWSILGSLVAADAKPKKKPADPPVAEEPAPPSETAAKEEARPPDATDLPEAPPGFSWLLVPEANASFLRPDGWFLKRQGDAGTTALFITATEIGEAGNRFETGLTVNIIRDIPGKKGVTPLQFALGLREVARGKATFLHENDAVAGKLRFASFVYADAEAGVTIANSLVANDTTGTLTWMIFESPTKEWESRLNEVGVITQMFVLDDEI